jgi:hypothetical protein
MRDLLNELKIWICAIVCLSPFLASLFLAAFITIHINNIIGAIAFIVLGALGYSLMMVIAKKI